jgi:Protein of unknown function (DUF1499)
MTDLIDFKTLQRPASPNTSFYAPAGFGSAAKADAAAPVYSAAPGELYIRALRLIGDRREWQLGTQDPARQQLNFVATSPLMRFKDDVDVIILPVAGDDGKSTFAAYSRSRVGYSDLGANRKRLDLFAAALQSA